MDSRASDGGTLPGQATAMTRREAIGHLGALGAGAAVAAAPRRGAAQPTRAPLKLTFWTWENPQQRPWLHKRITQYTENHPSIKVDFQWFTFTDLGKKVSVGFATGTAPDGFTTGDWLMPTWLARNLIAPLDVRQLGYPSVDAFRRDHADAFIAGAIQDGKVYGYPIWFYGFCNYLNTKQFKEVGLDPERDQPQTYAQLGEVAKRLTIKQGNKFVRQGFKFAMHAPQWTMIQFNPIVVQSGGQWFDRTGKCTINNEAGVRAMTVRASLAKQYGAEDPADSIATAPLPQMDWLKERCSMFSCHPIPPVAIKSQNPVMEAEGYYRPLQLPGVTADKRYSTCYGFNFVVNANAPRDKQEVLHDMYRFVMSDLVDCWQATAPFTLARKSGWTDDPRVKSFPHVQEIIRAKDNGVFFPRTPVWNELADAMHRAVQKVMLNNVDIKVALDEAAAEVDRATAEFKKS
jgi:ABC-type glycerol-3-phosphate transport system substrate-binding protein